MRRLALLALLATLAGCGSSHHFDGPTLVSVCGGSSPAKAQFVETSDGLKLYAAAEGKGDTTVVLAHESGGAGICGWLPTMGFFARNGVRTFAFDFRGTYPSPIPPRRTEHDYWRDLQAAVDGAHAKHVVLMGASMGGAAVMAFTHRLHGVDDVVNVSGEPSLDDIDAIDNVSKIHVPVLIVASRLDGYLDEEEARAMLRRTGSADKRLALYPGRLHGWDILNELPQSRQLVLQWIKQRQP